MGVTGQRDWVVLVPVKELGAAKTRLDLPRRDRVALAMSVDTVDAAASASLVREIVVVTDDPRALAALRAAKRARTPGAGVRVLPDAPRAGLNAALRHAAAIAASSHPDAGLAALAGDLPALRPAELDRALAAAAAAGGRSFVADAAGGGTVLLCATAGVELRPAFGAASRAEHAASGGRDLTGALGSEVAGLRRDVDTVGDLVAAAALGLGPATSRAAPGAGGAEAWQDPNHDEGAGVPGSALGRPPAQAPQRAAGTA